ncbi:basic amino acid/polyamine antiporter [Demequina sp. B12]|uniref:basic amino acid/polyamine antiporter n=1 Tax=Demequina sp. B12 TaxID=2992757 RepID=UPI00237B1DFD|nr:basic amino acid/polyamine antiporter [Demequina sp. B12]MDE0573232.1 basic amino acid/polyamine antiporter [Demequina sp. B12]
MSAPDHGPADEFAVPASSGRATMSVPVLTAMVVGTMVGAGVYSLPASFASSTGVAGAAIAWAIAGGGMLALAFVFQRLAIARPDLDSGIFAYAQAGFGDYIGFFSAFGYWVSACVANVTYWVLVSSTLGSVAPVFGDGDTFAALLLGTAGIWLFHFIIQKGVTRATVINGIATVAKMVPLAIFAVIIMSGAFSWETFTDNLWAEDGSLGSLSDQVRSTMLVTVFVFIGIEGASVYSRWARKREDVGKATVWGFLSVLAIFVAVTMLSYGVLPREDLAAMRQPSVAGVLEEAVGAWGAWVIGIGLLISVLGAYLAWCLLAVESLYMTARHGDAPAVLSHLNKNRVPFRALLVTSLVTQLFLVVAFFAESAFDFSLELTSALAILPYLLTAGFGLKIALNGGKVATAVAASSVATVYAIYLVYAMGLKYALLALIIYAPASLVYVWSRKQRGRKIFTPAEAVVCVLASIGAIAGVWALASGTIAL